MRFWCVAAWWWKVTIKKPEETAQAFTEDGFLKTGDAGEFDAEGNLFITDRIKELMKTSNGKYIAPQYIEGKIGKDKFIEQIAIIADAKNMFQRWSYLVLIA